MTEKEGLKIEGVIASLCLFGLGLLTSERGMFWIVESSERSEEHTSELQSH